MPTYSSETFLKNLNPEIKGLNPDLLYHLGLTSDTEGLREQFGDVRHVAMMGSGPRAYKFAHQLGAATGGKYRSLGQEPERDVDRMAIVTEQLKAVIEGNRDLITTIAEVRDGVARDAQLPEIIGKDERYWMFLVEVPGFGGVISVNHHMGQPTHAILLHEITKLLHHAEADRQGRPFEFSRLGTSGGLGIKGGDVVVAERGLDPSGKARYRLHVLGEELELPTEFDPTLVNAVFDCRDAIEAEVIKGDTVSCDDFYTEQARRDGAFCMVASEEAKLAYLRKLNAVGARNMEMEAAGFAAFCQHMGIPAVCVCTALLNRLNGDQVTASPQELALYSDGPQELLIRYICRKAGIAE